MSNDSIESIKYSSNDIYFFWRQTKLWDSPESPNSVWINTYNTYIWLPLSSEYEGIHVPGHQFIVSRVSLNFAGKLDTINWWPGITPPIGDSLSNYVLELQLQLQIEISISCHNCFLKCFNVEYSVFWDQEQILWESKNKRIVNIRNFNENFIKYSHNLLSIRLQKILPEIGNVKF